MNNGLASILISDVSNVYYLFSLIVVIAVAVFITILLSSKINWFLPKPFDTRLVDYLPFEKMLSDKKTILCLNGTLVRVFKVEGASIAFAKREVTQNFL